MVRWVEAGGDDFMALQGMVLSLGGMGGGHGDWRGEWRKGIVASWL